MSNFIPQDIAISFIKFDDVLDCAWRLSNKSALFQQIANFSQVVLIRKYVNVRQQLILGNASERVLDPALVSKSCVLSCACTYSPVKFSVIAARLAFRFFSSPMMMEPLRS